jgi:hypothetical protein
VVNKLQAILLSIAFSVWFNQTCLVVIFAIWWFSKLLQRQFWCLLVWRSPRILFNSVGNPISHLLPHWWLLNSSSGHGQPLRIVIFWIVTWCSLLPPFQQLLGWWEGQVIQKRGKDFDYLEVGEGERRTAVIANRSDGDCTITVAAKLDGWSSFRIMELETYMGQWKQW